jgi:hypothetical protein
VERSKLHDDDDEDDDGSNERQRQKCNELETSIKEARERAEYQKAAGCFVIEPSPDNDKKFSVSYVVTPPGTAKKDRTHVDDCQRMVETFKKTENFVSEFEIEVNVADPFEGDDAHVDPEFEVDGKGEKEREKEREKREKREKRERGEGIDIVFCNFCRQN